MSWAMLLPIIFQIVGYVLGKVKASKETKAAFLNLIEKAKLDPAICLKLKDDYKSMEDELKAGGGL